MTYLDIIFFGMNFVLISFLVYAIWESRHDARRNRRKVTGMTREKWEYNHFSKLDWRLSYREFFNTLGQDGWEIIHIYDSHSVWCKRKISFEDEWGAGGW